MEYAIKRKGQYESSDFSSEIVQTHGKGTITLQARIDDSESGNYLSIPGRNLVTKIDLPSQVTLKLVSKFPFSYQIPGLVPKYFGKRKIEDFLYEIHYGNIDYPYAYQYFKPRFFGGCSSVRFGNYFGRNFDWLYDKEVQFVIHTPSSLDHYAVLGVSGLIPGITQDTVDQDDIILEGVDMFKLVPFYLLDGINERGLFCTHNVVPLDSQDSPTLEVRARVEERDRVCIPMLPRFILDKFSSTSQAIGYLRDYTTLFFTEEMLNSGYQSHFLLGDSKRTYVLEFIDSELKVIPYEYITNFQIYDVKFAKDRTIQYPPGDYGVGDFGSGLERWDIISKGYSKSRSLDGMRDLMKSIEYSNTYGDPFWCSEITGMIDDSGNKITVNTPKELCSSAIEASREAFRNKSREDPKVWITCHSGIYDLKKKFLYIRNQERENEYLFTMEED